MNGDVVLQEKLRIPEVSGLARERLEKPLREGLPTALDVVVAPAGSGKTTLLARVAASATVPVGWYRITSDDSTEHRLVAHLAGALGHLTGVRDDASVEALLRGLDRWSGSGGLLILDDVHEVVGTPAERALERFVSLRPRRLQLICGSRRMPEVNVPRIRVSGSLREIGSDDLRFRSWEVEELFATVYYEPLRPEAAAALTRRTGGWAAGLQLFHLSTAGRTASERHQAVADLGGRSKLVRSYLTRNVLADLPEDWRQFLLRTCTLGRLSGAVCDALLETGGSHRILEKLENAQFFTFTDDGGIYFRYHEILQTHLEMALVEEYGTAEARQWYLRSGALLESMGEHRSAARAYAKAGDWVAVSQLVQDTNGARIDATLVDDDHLLPASTWRDDPWLALANARRLVREGALKRAADAYSRAEGLYDEPTYQQMCRYEKQAVTMWLPQPGSGGLEASPAAPLRHWSGFLRDALRMSPNFSALPAPAATSDARVGLGNGLAALVAGEVRLARDALVPIRQKESPDSLVMIVASLALAALDMICGTTPEPGCDLSDIATIAEKECLPWLSRLCHGLQQIMLTTSGEAPWRLECCADIIDGDDRMGDHWGAGLLTLGFALAKQHLGVASAAADFDDAANRFQHLGAPVLEVWCRLLGSVSESDPATAQWAVEISRALNARGALSLAMAMRARIAPNGKAHELSEAVSLAAACGMPLPNNAFQRSRTVARSTAEADFDGGHRIPAVRIFCFGGYRIELDGRIADVAQLRPQARNVLQILSMSHDHNHHREVLEDILWPGVDHSVACHRLQVAVSSVRTMFADGELIVRRSGESYRLCLPPGAGVDVRDFEEAVSKAATLSARGDLEGRMSARRNALELYRGDLLPELATVDYVDSERRRLRRSAAAAAAVLASDYRTLGDHEHALEAAQRSVQLDPYQDFPWRIMAELHERVGDLGSAEYVRREHARMMVDLETATP